MFGWFKKKSKPEGDAPEEKPMATQEQKDILSKAAGIPCRTDDLTKKAAEYVMGLTDNVIELRGVPEAKEVAASVLMLGDADDGDGDGGGAGDEALEAVDAASKDELQDMCRGYGLPVSGTKDEIKDRLREFLGE